jgi:hypothetical protein
MICPQCKSKEFKTGTVLDDAGDVQRTVCANESCQYIIGEKVIEKAADGTERMRPRSVSLEDQPEGLAFGGGADYEDDGMLTAEAMMLLAVQTKEETVGKAAKEIAKTILVECAKVVLDGEYTYLIEEDDTPPGAVIKQVVQELKDRKYKVKQTPVPGKGMEIKVQWPTKKPQKTSKRRAAEAAHPVGIVEKSDLTPKQRKQEAEKAKRKAAYRARSKSPK